jgi:hypothetical protein
VQARRISRFCRTIFHCFFPSGCRFDLHNGPFTCCTRYYLCIVCSSDYNLDKHELSESEAAPTMPYNTRKRSFSVVAEDISSSSCIDMDALDAYNPAPAVPAAAATERCMETMDRVERKKSREKKRRVEVCVNFNSTFLQTFSTINRDTTTSSGLFNSA